MTDELNYLKCLEDPYRDLGLHVGNHRNNPCPFHDGSDHMSIWIDSDGYVRWKCFNPAGIEDDSGSIIDLLMHIKNLSLEDAISELKAQYLPGGGSSPDTDWVKPEPKPTVRPHPSKTQVAPPTQVMRGDRYFSGPGRPLKNNQWTTMYFKDATLLDTVTCEYDGKRYGFATGRWDLDDGSKFLRPFTWVDGEWEVGIKIDQNYNRPPYKLDDLDSDTRKTVYIVEGEKCMHALQDAIDALADEEFFKPDGDPTPYENTVVTTCFQSNFGSTDWTYLANHKVIVVPDLDKPGAEKAEQVARMCPHSDVTVLWPESNPNIDMLPDNGGDDIADYLDDPFFNLRKFLARPGVDPMDIFEIELEPDIAVTRGWYEGLEARNYEIVEYETQDKNGKPVTKLIKVKMQMRDIVQQVHNIAEGDWPAMVGTKLAVQGPDWGKIAGKDPIRWIPDSTELSSWLQETTRVFWSDSQVWQGDEKTRSANFGELLRSLKSLAPTRFINYQTIPHEPPIDGMLYTARVEPGDGRFLEKLVEKLNAATDVDRDLLEACILTPFWGGGPGKRPAFVFTTDYGRGVGKSSTAEAIAKIYGGAPQIQEDEDWDQVMQRILTDSSSHKRILFIDNMKKMLDSGPLEGAITRHELSGKKMYEGEATIPNLFTWIMSANTPELSTDLADRAVVIEFGKPNHRFNFDGWFSRFLELHHADLLGDIMARLQEDPRCELDDNTRFQEWDQAILTRFENGNEMIKALKSRKGEVDEEAKDAHRTYDMIRSLLESRGFDVDEDHVWIPTDALTEGLQEMWQVSNITPRRFWTEWKKISVQPIFHNRWEKGRWNQDRGLYWNSHLNEDPEKLNSREVVDPSAF